MRKRSSRYVVAGAQRLADARADARDVEAKRGQHVNISSRVVDSQGHPCRRAVVWTLGRVHIVSDMSTAAARRHAHADKLIGADIQPDHLRDSIHADSQSQTQTVI